MGWSRKKPRKYPYGPRYRSHEREEDWGQKRRRDKQLLRQHDTEQLEEVEFSTAKKGLTSVPVDDL